MPRLSIDIVLWTDRTYNLSGDLLKDFTRLLFIMRAGNKVSEVYMLTAYGKEKRNLLAPCFDIDDEGYWHYPDVDKMIKSDKQRRNNGFKKKNTTCIQHVDNTTTTHTKKPKSKQSKSPPEQALYTKCVDIYFKWFKEEWDVEPTFDGSDGKAMKVIIKWLEKNSKGTKPEDTLIYIFSNWHLLNTFTKDKTRIRDISSNLNSIITQFKNGKNGGLNKTQEEYLTNRTDL